MTLIKNIDKKNISDWLELYVVLEWRISKADILSEFSDIFEDNNYCEDDLESEFINRDIDDLFMLLWSRLYLYWNNPPYNINGDIISSNFSSDSHSKISYIFSLFLSIYWNSFETNEVWKLFERLSNEAFKEYLWWESKVFWFPDWVTWNLSSKIDNLAIEINEKRWRWEPLTHAKDDKLDLISYKSIDSRENKIVFLIQSASGKDWKSKLTELSIDLWKDYINFSITPIRWFSTPVFIDEDREFFDRAKRSWLLFDRARIYRFVSKVGSLYDENLCTDISSWNIRAVNNYS